MMCCSLFPLSFMSQKSPPTSPPWALLSSNLSPPHLHLTTPHKETVNSHTARKAPQYSLPSLSIKHVTQMLDTYREWEGGLGLWCQYFLVGCVLWSFSGCIWNLQSNYLYIRLLLSIRIQHNIPHLLTSFLATPLTLLPYEVIIHRPQHTSLNYPGYPHLPPMLTLWVQLSICDRNGVNRDTAWQITRLNPPVPPHLSPHHSPLLHAHPSMPAVTKEAVPI